MGENALEPLEIVPDTPKKSQPRSSILNCKPMLSARSRAAGEEDKWEEYVRGRRRETRKHKQIGKRWRFFE